MLKVMYNSYLGAWYFSEDGIDWFSANEFVWEV